MTIDQIRTVTVVTTTTATNDYNLPVEEVYVLFAPANEAVVQSACPPEIFQRQGSHAETEYTPHPYVRRQVKQVWFWAFIALEVVVVVVAVVIVVDVGVRIALSDVIPVYGVVTVLIDFVIDVVLLYFVDSVGSSIGWVAILEVKAGVAHSFR